MERTYVRTFLNDNFFFICFANYIMFLREIQEGNIFDFRESTKKETNKRQKKRQKKRQEKKKRQKY